jgi:hypothetical protein
VRDAISLVFCKFAEFQSMRQVHLWLRQERIRLPAVDITPEARRIVWKLPVYNTILKMLTNPVYAGAYAFGRTGSRVSVAEGRKRVLRGVRRPREEWEVLLLDRHEGYVSWAEFERNQRLIADNANAKGLMARGSVRRGDALLAGLLRCGHCGRRLHVSYSGTAGFCVRYNCRGAHLNHGAERCISFGGLRVDAAVAVETLRQLAPLGIEASLRAMEKRGHEADEVLRQLELALAQARYEADLARRQYDAVDPAYRLVAAELERRWNDRLAEVQCLEERLETARTNRPTAATAEEQARLMALGADLSSAGIIRARRRRPASVCCEPPLRKSWRNSRAIASIWSFTGAAAITRGFRCQKTDRADIAGAPTLLSKSSSGRLPASSPTRQSRRH